MKTSGNTNEASVNLVSEEYVSIQEIIEKDGNVFKSQEDNKIYVEFVNDLYAPDGSSNEHYFENLAKSLTRALDKKDYYLIDKSKDIKITLYYDLSTREYEITYNDIEGFYSKTDGKTYVAVDKVDHVKGETMYLADKLLDYLLADDFYIKSIKEYIGEGKKINELYTDYLDGKLSIKIGSNNAVKNIVYRDGYGDGYITNDITLNTTLDEILKLYPNPAFGSIEEGFLGYRNSRVYAFYYPDEISLHTYGYDYNLTFEDLLEDYMKDKDLKKFKEKLLSKWAGYSEYEFNEEEESFQVMYPGKGLKIDIKNNDPKGITLYSNYKIGSRAKQYVKNGLITLNADEDLIYIVEKERRKNNSK